MGINLKSFISAFVADKKGGFGTRQCAAGTWRALNKNTGKTSLQKRLPPNKSGPISSIGLLMASPPDRCKTRPAISGGLVLVWVGK